MPRVMHIVVHDSANPEADLHQAALPSWHVSIKFDCAAFVLKPITDSFFESGYSLTRVRAVHGDDDAELNIASLIVPTEQATYHFYYTGVRRTETVGSGPRWSSNPKAFGIRPATGFR